MITKKKFFSKGFCQGKKVWDIGNYSMNEFEEICKIVETFNACFNRRGMSAHLEGCTIIFDTNIKKYAEYMDRTGLLDSGSGIEG